MSQTVAIVKWSKHDGIANVLGYEAAQLGYAPSFFMFDQAIPLDADMVLSFAPYGRWLQIPQQLRRVPKNKRPVFIHWSTENPPNLNYPWAINRALAAARVRLEPLSFFQKRMVRYRIMGEYLQAHANGWMDVFVESSLVFADFYTRHGLPARFAPWGAVKQWSADLGLERDIDVLWMGQRRTKRRSEGLENIRRALNAHGYKMHIADGEENPFLYGEARTQMLNRSKITVSLLAQAPHDNIFHYRFRLTAPNRSLLVTEQELAHCDAYQAGTHYVEAPGAAMVETILKYLQDDAARHAIVENAYRLATTTYTLNASVRGILQEGARARAERGG